MAYDADAEVDLRGYLLSKQRRHTERQSGHDVVPAIKMLIGKWYTDELGVLTREITARD